MKRITMTDEVWSLFYGALIGLRMPGVTGAHFYAMPHVEAGVRAIQEAEDMVVVDTTDPLAEVESLSLDQEGPVREPDPIRGPVDLSEYLEAALDDVA